MIDLLAENTLLRTLLLLLLFAVVAASGEWPPRAAGATLVVNATPVRDDPLVDVTPSAAVVDLAYRPDGRPTALIEAARSAGCERVVEASGVDP